MILTMQQPLLSGEGVWFNKITYGILYTWNTQKGLNGNYPLINRAYE